MLAERPRVRLTLKSAARTPRTPTAGAKYVARLARSADEVQRAQQLRFEVFNLEVGEGWAESYTTALDIDPFDEIRVNYSFSPAEIRAGNRKQIACELRDEIVSMRS
jgi:hypothetical protein